MDLSKIATHAGLVTAAALVAFAGLAGEANASSANIDQWTSLSSCDVSSPYYFCLYFSPDHTGGVWRSTSAAVRTISGTFSGGAGNGRPVRNDAASADNGTDCHVGIWVSPGWMGNSNWLIQGNHGGNLTSSPLLRNNEASIAVDDSTNCPGVGIG